MYFNDDSGKCRFYRGAGIKYGLQFSYGDILFFGMLFFFSVPNNC